MPTVISKVRMMVENIGFPDYIVDDNLIDEEYKNVSKNPTIFRASKLA